MSNKDELNIPSEQIETKEEIKEQQENNEKKEEEEAKTEEKKEESKPEEKKENENEEEKEKSDDEEKEKSEEEKESDSGSEESKNSGSAGSGESKKKKDKEEENEEDDEDDEDDDIDVDDDDDVGSEESSSESKQKDPYHGYLNSKTDYKSFYSDICRDDYLYGYKQNKFYKIMGSKSDKKAPVYTFELKEIKVGNKNTKKNLKLTKNMQYMASLYGKLIKDDKKEEKKDEIKIDKKDVKKEELTNEIKEEKNDEVKGDLKEEKKEDNKEEQKDKNKDKKEKEKDRKEKNTKKNKKPKNTNLKEVIRDFSEYTFFQKIRIIYLNSLNNPVVFYHKININCSIKEIVNQFLSLYHFKHEKYSDKVPLFFFINGKKHSTSNRTRNKFFIPTKFDYKNDYVLILEKQNLKLKEFDLGTRSNYLNLRGALIPHVVYNSLYNFDIDSFIISKDLVSLECQIFEFKKEINIRQHTDNERTIKQKLKDILDLNWKEKSNLIATIKSVKVQKSKDNYNANLFELSRRFIMPQGKIYIFLIKSSYKKLYAFCGRHISSEGIFIVSKNDKSLLNGFRGKTMSDFVAYS